MLLSKIATLALKAMLEAERNFHRINGVDKRMTITMLHNELNAPISFNVVFIFKARAVMRLLV